MSSVKIKNHSLSKEIKMSTNIKEVKKVIPTKSNIKIASVKSVDVDKRKKQINQLRNLMIVLNQ